MLSLAAFVVILSVGTANCQWPTTDPTLAFWDGPVAVDCQCSDVVPRAAFTQSIANSSACAEYQASGQCDLPFMLNSVKELPEGYCQISCGRCPCCSPIAEVLGNNSLATLAQAADIAGLSAQLSQPGTMVTLFAPTDEAFAAALPALGANSLADVPESTLTAILNYHTLPVVPFIETAWTTPFFSALSGPLETELPGARIAVEPSGDTYILTGVMNSARIITPDIEACKAYINLIDTVLIPPGLGTASEAAGQLAPSLAVGPGGAVSPTATALPFVSAG